jgi:hypothetical protein
LLSSLFVNGTSLEQQKIATQLFSALHENENISPILLSLRCLNEIVEETNLTTQIKMLTTLSNRFHELSQNLPWKGDETAIEVLCFIAKIYRKIATKASECKLADDILGHETEILVGSFGPWIEIVLMKLSETFQTSEEIFTNLPLLLEIIKFICIAFECFPYLYEVNEQTILPTITGLCWKYLICLIEMKHLNSEELKSYETASEDGDRVSIDIFVILIFELLQLCLGASGDNYHQDSSSSSSSPLMGSNELMNLIRVLMRYIQLSSEQYDQATFSGNEFIAAEEDDTLELSLRHTGKIFLKNLSKTSFKDLMESIFQILETDLNEFNHLFATASPAIESISFEWVLKLEAMIFILAAIGRPIMKKYFKSIKGEMSVSCSPAPFVKRSQTQRHRKEMEETINESDAMRLSQIIHTLVNNFYQFPSNAQELTPQEITSFSSLAIVRGGVSKLLTIFSPILVKFISLQPIISTSLNLSLLPSISPGERYHGISEPLSSRLLHCRAFGELLRIGSKTYGPMTITQNPSPGDQSLVQVALQSCIELCPLCNDSTIHIPLEIMTNLLNIVTQSFESEFQSTHQQGITSSAETATHLSDDVIIHLVRIGLTVWSVYCYDPFALEMAKDMLFATVHTCSFRPNTLSIFLEQFIPPIEHFIGELVGNQSSKMISDLAVKLLAESVSQTSSFSSYGPEASQRLSLPAIQAIMRIMHFSTDVDGVIDVGDTLHSLVILLSSKYFTLTSFPQAGDDILDDFIQETLLCIRMIFTKCMDYNYSSAIGSLYQLVSHFPNHPLRHGQERGSGYQEFIQQTVNLIMSLGKTNNHRNILIMGLVHIFNKNPLLIAESLGHIQLTNHSGGEGGRSVNTNETALQYLLEVWFELHPLLESPYSLSVSTNGLIELIQMYSLQGISSGFLIRVLRLLLETLPSVLRNETQSQEVSFSSLVGVLISLPLCLLLLSLGERRARGSGG